MKAKFPGRFETYGAIQPAEVFMHRYQNGTVLLAIKTRWPVNQREYAVELIAADAGNPSKVKLDFNQQLSPDRTAFVLDRLEIAPFDLGDFVAQPPTGSIDAGWFGLAGDRPVLSFEHNQNNRPLVGFVDLDSGDLMDDPPKAGWFRKWRITRAGPKEPEHVFEMKR